MFLFSKNDSINNYVVVFQHKEGSYAQTYRVRDENGKAKFMKLIFQERLEPYQLDEKGDVLEIDIAKQLSHNNLCEFIDVGSLEKDGHLLSYIVTEYVRGEDLNKRLYRTGAFSLQEVKQIMSALLSAISYIHTLPRPVIHNEITVENIMLDLVGNLECLKLIDFGSARYTDLAPSSQSWHYQDLHYVASERLFGEGTIQSDIFSAGVVLYKLIFGVLPWETKLAGLTAQEQAQAIFEKRKEPLTIPNVQIMELDNNLIKVMLKALAPKAEQRFSSAQEFLDALNGKIEIKSAPTSMTKMHEAENSKEISPIVGNGFADVAGMTEIKSLMQKKIINVLKDKERAERFKIAIPNGMLLYGPPGCGKSFIAEKFAEEAGYNYVFVKSSDLASIYVHGSQEKIGNLFDEARKNAPTIINFDEFEALVSNRGQVNNASQSAEVNEFLSQMNNCGKDGVFVIASSNRPDLIDPAILRKGRIDHIIYIPLPDLEARKGMFELYLKERPIDGNLDYLHLAELTENFVASDIAFITNDAATRAFEDDTNITQKLLEDIIKENVPSVSREEIRKYEELKTKMEGGAKKEVRRIGFS
jgi:transitional endoplasmic reticulum ATPase